MQKTSKNMLLCLAGKSPQIVTEALYCLTIEKSIKVERLCILTTNECSSSIIEALVPEFNSFKKMYPLARFAFSRKDIKSAEEEISGLSLKDNCSLTSLIFETVRAGKQEGYNLHCFISGGRKTMSVDLAIAMTIYGTEQDKLYHVIASPEFASSGKFYPESPEEAEGLILIEKPYIKLKQRTDISANNDVSSLVKTVQTEIDSSVMLPSMTIYTSDRRIKVAGQEFRFQPLVFAIYLFFAKQNKFIRGGKNFSRTHSEALWNIYTKISPSFGHSDRVARSGFEEGKIDFDLVQKSVSVIRNKFAEVFEGEHISEFYSISTEGTYADKRYGIKLPKSKIQILK